MIFIRRAFLQNIMDSWQCTLGKDGFLFDQLVIFFFDQGEGKVEAINVNANDTVVTVKDAKINVKDNVTPPKTNADNNSQYNKYLCSIPTYAAE